MGCGQERTQTKTRKVRNPQSLYTDMLYVRTLYIRITVVCLFKYVHTIMHCSPLVLMITLYINCIPFRMFIDKYDRTQNTQEEKEKVDFENNFILYNNYNCIKMQ